jgi:hypothetical protein
MLEDALCDYYLVDTFFNRLFHSGLIAKYRTDIFRKYQFARLQLDIRHNDELQELIDDVEREIL